VGNKEKEALLGGGAQRQVAQGRRVHQPGHADRLMQLPAVSRRAERLVGPMRGLLIDG
jgi:hypothetical protein